ncbi:MAG: SdpI family protein [Bacteroidetes bacterium]|nr:SdpI family protein [Bacteroidota bacterium]MDA0880160.1 SdpI family protein [Bacteroidota bacterium]
MNLPFDNPLFLIPSTSGLIFMLAGFIMLKFPPKKINSLYGYRTRSSMKNQERWDFSQKYSAIAMIKLAAILTLSSIIGLIYNPDGELRMFLGLGLMILMVVVLLIRVEKAIKNKFGNEK